MGVVWLLGTKDNVGSAVSLNNIADLSNKEGTGSILEGLHHLSGAKGTQIATVTVGAAVATTDSLIAELNLTCLDVFEDGGQLGDSGGLGDLGGGLVGTTAHGVTATLVLDQYVGGADLGHIESWVFKEGLDKHSKYIGGRREKGGLQIDLITTKFPLKLIEYSN
jgi:hypothetical protein